MIKNSLVIQWLGLHASTARGLGSIPGKATKTPQLVARPNKQTLGKKFFKYFNFKK